MTDEFRKAYADLLDRTPEPPDWAHLGLVTATPRRASGPRGPLVAVGAGLAALVIIGAVAGLLSGTPLAFAPATVDYVRLSWSQTIDPICAGMTLNDDGGFDSATIEVWGPDPDGRMRADITAPDGSVARVVAEVDESGRTQRAWASMPMFGSRGSFEDAAAFRTVECVVETETGTTAYGISEMPYVPMQIPSLQFTSVAPDVSLDHAERRMDVWRGIDVEIYRSADTSTNDLDTVEYVIERWVDPSTGRHERTVFERSSDVLGSARSVTEVVDRRSVEFDDEHFSIDGLHETFDIAGSDSMSVSTTTSIVAIEHPMMGNAVEIDVAEIGNRDLRVVIDAQDVDRLFEVPVGDDRAVVVRLRLGGQPHMYATSCAVLTSVELPEGWAGVCLEVTRDGIRESGRFWYDEAREILGS